MKRRLASIWLGVLSLVGLAAHLQAQSLPDVVTIGVPQSGKKVEFRVLNVPVSPNPFDPDLIRVEALFVFPSGRTLTVPAFWYQGYTRSLSGSSEVLNAYGVAEWRLRFTPFESGTYNVSVTVRTNGTFVGTSSPRPFTVATNTTLTRTGYPRVGSSKRSLETTDGQALRLIGENVCWPGSRGTFDYDTYFPAMQTASENFARLWMCPWAFSLETDTNSLVHYRLDHAWQLDYVFQVAEQQGVYLMLCLDYHGMFETQPDYWGGNNYWPQNPYNITNGGPCVNQNAFFTNSTAQTIYQKRLRYLTARYGYSQNLLAWEFFNEIDNVYSYLNANDVAAWHSAMGGWLHTNDPFSHLVTSSLTGGSDRSEFWSVPQLDFAQYHSYGDTSPAARLNQVVQSALLRYTKPMLIGEFGSDWRGWNRQNDPYLRGFRQGIWGGALSGSTGTAMSWWWENIQSENVYPLYTALGKVLNRTGWGRGAWTNIDFRTSGPPPVTVGNPVTNGQAFNATLILSGLWGDHPSGQLAVANGSSADYAPNNLNAFVQGTAHPDLRVPFHLNAWFTNNARIVMHLNSVSGGAIMTLRVDGTETYRTNLPNLDGTWNVNNEYNLDFPVSLPAGKHALDIVNAGVDWFYLDWVRLENVLPADYSPVWTPSPVCIGLRGGRESLVYVVAPGAAFPAGGTNATLPLQQAQSVTFSNWPAGKFYADWYDPQGGTNVTRTQSTTTNGLLTLAMPDFREDLAGVIYPQPQLAFVQPPSNPLGLLFTSESGGEYQMQRSSNLVDWTSWTFVTNASGVLQLSVVPDQPAAFFRAIK